MATRPLCSATVLVVAGALLWAGCGQTKGSSAKPKGGAQTTTSTTTTGAGVSADTTPLATTTTSSTPMAANMSIASKASTTTPKKASTTRASTVLPAASPRLQVTAPPPTQAPAEQAQPGGTLTLLANVDGGGYDPTKATGATAAGDSYRMFAVYDKLVYAEGATGSVAPELAEALTTADAKTWTMKIRPNVKFSDGTTLDAAAVKFNWDRHADPANASPRAPTVKSMTYIVTDPLTLTITLNAVYGQFPLTVADQLYAIGSPKAITAAGSQANYNSQPVGAGPFILKQWVRDSQAVFVRNPTYWNTPRPYVDQLVIKTVLDETARLNALRTGDGDMSFTNVQTR